MKLEMRLFCDNCLDVRIFDKIESQGKNNIIKYQCKTCGQEYSGNKIKTQEALAYAHSVRTEGSEGS